MTEQVHTECVPLYSQAQTQLSHSLYDSTDDASFSFITFRKFMHQITFFKTPFPFSTQVRLYT